jgi:hypothetical protein
MRTVLGVFILCIAGTPNLRAQGTADNGKSLIWYESLTGTSSSLGNVSRLDSMLGYNFNHHFALDFGAPILFVHSSSSTTTNLRSASGLGDIYGDVRFTVRNPLANFVSNLRATVPTGSTKDNFSSGRATVDWSNHFDRTFGHVTPFADIGVANTVPDSTYFVRPYTTLGVTGHFDAGASVRILPLLNLRASGYAIEPSGQQKVFSRFLNRQATPGNSASHGRVFQAAPETTGTADIARDHGFSIGIDSSPFQLVDLAIGYTHSMSFALDTLYFGIGVNLARLLGSASH